MRVALADFQRVLTNADSSTARNSADASWHSGMPIKLWNCILKSFSNLDRVWQEPQQTAPSGVRGSSGTLPDVMVGLLLIPAYGGAYC